LTVCNRPGCKLAGQAGLAKPSSASHCAALRFWCVSASSGLLTWVCPRTPAGQVECRDAGTSQWNCRRGCRLGDHAASSSCGCKTLWVDVQQLQHATKMSAPCRTDEDAGPLTCALMAVAPALVGQRESRPESDGCPLKRSASALSGQARRPDRGRLALATSVGTCWTVSTLRNGNHK
jgi:hypothetical protein